MYRGIGDNCNLCTNVSSIHRSQINRINNCVKRVTGNCCNVNQRVPSLSDESSRFVVTRAMKELSPILIVSWSDPRGSYPRFNYRYQVTCSSFRVPEQLTPLRVHRMQMTSRPSVRLSVHPLLVRQGGWLGSHQTIAKCCLLSRLSISMHIK